MADKPIIFSSPMVRAILDGRKTQTRRVLSDQERWDRIGGILRRYPRQRTGLPYAPGDRLWVRETWAEVGSLDPGIPVYRASYPSCLPDGMENVPERIEDAGYRWRSPIHMPRRLSRITLHVTDVMVQRVQEISEDDARAEGVIATDTKGVPCWRGYEGAPLTVSEIVAFRDLWDSLNAKRGYCWEQNPWVVAITFRPEFRNIDAVAEAA